MADEFYVLIIIAMTSAVAILFWRVNNLEDAVRQSEHTIRAIQGELESINDAKKAKVKELELDTSNRVNYEAEDNMVQDHERSLAKSSEEYKSSDDNFDDKLQEIAKSIENNYKANLDALAKSEEKYQSFEETIKTVEEKYKSENSKVEELEENYKSLEKRFSEKTELLQKHVGFSARLGGHVQDMAPWGTLVFNTVLTNIGNAYSETTGVFTAPVVGVYIFYAHILGSQRNLEMCVQKNDGNVMYMYTHGPAGGLNGDGNMVVLSLVKGDTIKVAKHGPWGTKPFYVHASWSTFSGYLLYPL